MLRVTTHDKSDSLTLQVEGKLAGPWVGVLRECWQKESALAYVRRIYVDLRAVTFVDAAGRALLAEMSQQNAQLIAGDCQMKAILAEVGQAK